MATLKELHEQVGKLPFLVTRDDSLPVTIEHLASSGDYCGVFTFADKSQYAKIYRPDDHDDWQLVPEKKKALAYVNVNGDLQFGLEGTKSIEEFKKYNETYTRASEFDIESGKV